MKKLSSCLVLMLIALMLFVSCNGSTPTKLEERDATVEDAVLVLSSFVAAQSITDFISTNGNLPPNVQLGNNSYSHFVFVEPGYTFNKNEVSGTLIGNLKFEIAQDLSSITYSCDLTKGTIINGKAHELKASVKVYNYMSNPENNAEPEYIVEEVIIDGKKVNNLKDKIEYLISGGNSNSI